jgi:hypothetical protein
MMSKYVDLAVGESIAAKARADAALINMKSIKRVRRLKDDVVGSELDPYYKPSPLVMDDEGIAAELRPEDLRPPPVKLDDIRWPSEDDTDEDSNIFGGDDPAPPPVRKVSAAKEIADRHESQRKAHYVWTPRLNKFVYHRKIPDKNPV